MKLKASVLKYVLLFCIGIGILYLLFSKQFNHQFLTDLQNAHWIWAIVSGFFILLAHFIRSLRWRLMITPENPKRPSIINVFFAVMTGYFVNLILPRAGELVRCSWLAKKEKISTMALIGTVITERIIDLLMLAIFVAITFFLYNELIFAFLQQLNFHPTALLSWPAVAAIIVLVLIISGICYGLKKKNAAIFLRVKVLIKSLNNGLLSITRLQQPVLFILYTALIWLCYTLSSYYCFKVFTETAILDFPAAVLTVVGGSFGMIAPIQGGIGAYHFMITECLALIHINKTIGFEFATIIHAVQTLVIILFGMTSLILGFDIHIFTHHEQPEDPAS